MTEVDPILTVAPAQQARTDEPIADYHPTEEVFPKRQDGVDPREATYRCIGYIAWSIKAALLFQPPSRPVSEEAIYEIAVANAAYEGHNVAFLYDFDKDRTPGGRHRLEDKRPISFPRAEWEALDPDGMRAVLSGEAGRHAAGGVTDPPESDRGSVYTSTSGDTPPAIDDAAEAPPAEPADIVPMPAKDPATPAGSTGAEPAQEGEIVSPAAGPKPAEAPPSKRKRRFTKVAAALAAVPTWLGLKAAQVRRNLRGPREGETELEWTKRLAATTFLAGTAALLAIGLLSPAQGSPRPPRAGPGPVVVTPNPVGPAPAPQPVGPADLSLAYSGATIWGETVDYAQAHGVTLSESQKSDIVGDILQSNGQTWSSARHLPHGFTFIINGYEVSQILHANG